MTDMATQAQAHVGRKAANKRVKFIIGGAVIALAIIYLIFTTTQSTASYFLTVEELYDKGSAIYDRNVRVSGMVMGDGVDFNSRELTLKFEIAGASGETLPVVFNGPKPDQMRHGADAILEGKYDGEIFVADSLLLKCPSRYEEGVIEEVQVDAVR